MEIAEVSIFGIALISWKETSLKYPFSKILFFRFLGDMLSKKKPFVDSPSSATQGKDKKLKKMVFPGTGSQGSALPETETAENDEDYEPTAMLGMMSEFQREAGITAPKEAVNSSKHMMHQASLSVSTVI